MRIEKDKYYTPIEIAKRCFDKTIEIIGYNNITEIIEPSAGDGSFSSLWPFCIAYDIEPEHPDIAMVRIKQYDIYNILKREIPEIN